MLDDQQYNIKKVNEKLSRIFKKVDKLQRGYITRSQIMYNWPKDENIDMLKFKILHCLADCQSGVYLDILGFLDLVHFIVSLGLYTIR